MSTGTIYQAIVISSNTVNFAFPYSGPQHAFLGLVTHPRNGNNVVLRIERGQFMCPSYMGCNVLVRFDDGDPESYSAQGPSDNTTNMIGIKNYSRFVERMIRASRVRISAEVFQEGAPVFDFDVRGFDVTRYMPGS